MSHRDEDEDYEPPEEEQQQGGGRRRGRRGRGAGSSVGSEDNEDPLFPRGPAPGIKWRGGAPPAAPTFSGDRKADPRCWEHWRDSVDAWKFRVKHYLPLPEAALLLRDSVTGEALKEIITEPPMTWATDDGIERLVDSMKAPFGEQEIFHTGDLLAAYERIRRGNGEKLHSYCTRYVRVERALKQVKINISDTLDAQA